MKRPVLAFLALLLAAVVGPAYALNGGAGRGAVKDDKNYNDRITLTMIGVPAIPRDKVYEAWLVTDNGVEQFSLGNIKVESDGTVRHAVTRDENLFARYDKLRVSLEPRDKQDPKQAGPTVFEGEIPLPVMTHVRHLLVFYSEAPGGTALAIGLRNQASITLRQINQASAAASSGDLGKVKENAEAIVNVVEGSKGPNFGNLNGDENIQNPGDGYGLMTYTDKALAGADSVAQAEDATSEMKLSAKDVQSAVGNVANWTTKVRDNALLILQAGDVDSVKPLLETMAKDGMAALNGIDANGNGLVEPVEGEGGALTAYVHAQNIGTYDVRPTQESSATIRSQAQDEAGGLPRTVSMPLGAIPTIIFGLIAGTAAIGALAFLWVKLKMGITSR